MENRLELQNEYRKLINKLNSTNRKANEKTEIHFFIREITSNQKQLIVKANSEKYLNIGEMSGAGHLTVDINFEFLCLGKYIKENLTSFDGKSDINIFIRAAILRLYNYDSR